MFVIVCYDIVEDRRRNKVLKYLKGAGIHVQKSVFECYLNKNQIEQLKKKLQNLIDEKEDSIRIYIAPEYLVENTRVLGLGEVNRYKPLIFL